MKDTRYIEVDAGVRYWEDCILNGVADELGKMPLRVGDRWQPVIDLHSGQVLNWPEGFTADVHYKVCDDGDYWLLDEAKKRIAKWTGFYVPDKILCVGDRGYGDYIIFKIGADGKIEGWKEQALNAEDWARLSQE